MHSSGGDTASLGLASECGKLRRCRSLDASDTSGIVRGVTTPDYLARYDPPLQPTGAASEERERAAQVLCLQFAAGNLETEELEHRLALVYQSQTSADLERLLTGLPALSGSVEFGGGPLLAPSGAVPQRGVIMAFMSGAERKGSWLCPRELKIYALMGGVAIDLREARFAPGVTEIDVTVVMGGVEIIVPRGVRVEVMGGAFMGGFVANAGDATALDPAQPVLRVSGLAVMGGVDVTMKKPSRKAVNRFEAALRVARGMVR